MFPSVTFPITQGYHRNMDRSPGGLSLEPERTTQNRPEDILFRNDADIFFSPLGSLFLRILVTVPFAGNRRLAK